MEWNKSIKELNFIFDASHNGIMVVDENGIIVIYNRAAGKVLKRNPALLIGRPAREALPHAWPDLKRILETGISQIGIKLTFGESSIVANRTPINFNGKTVGVISIFQDISEYEKIITELETYKRIIKELDAIINSSYDGLYITDGKANTLRVNKAYERISGFRAKDLIGRNMKELVKKGFFDQSVTLEVLKTKKPVTIMQDIRGGKKAMVTGNPIFDEDTNEIILVVTNVRDVSELDNLRKKLEDSRQISEKYFTELQELRLYSLKREDFIAKSEAMKKILHIALKVAKVDTSTFIGGESGVGKGLLAKIIHNNSYRAGKSFIKINCGAIPEALLESELFGYEKGAFTGARTEGKPGLFEVADGGTILLDEIAELPFHLQVKLLSILEDKQVIRLGGTKPRHINVRIIATSNTNLEKLVDENKFRKDLFFRLNVIPIYIPPLRERREDIFPLINSFLSKFNKLHKKKKRILGEALDLLMMYSYPGNIRELQNVIERSVVISESDLIGGRDIPFYVWSKEPENSLSTDFEINNSLNRLMQNIEARLIEDAISEYRTTYNAARHLGVSQSTVVRKMQKYSIKKNNA
ncbi:MAG: sigma 54-interacting transcriptional regulator [Deltaproteobacteria bacterium]|nr:sigma 54-interacting transcriptional regulator [Deltaproteobacteria bacterium]MBW2033809.1 sigma 54-interacting transcriptional regulator [Deltaproteobacteria bacterium]MBW2169680.1 sigma 54-interacting transcriptional regulator [Deltaproteobacteria bacterium]